jgi:hypothetical protein
MEEPFSPFLDHLAGLTITEPTTRKICKPITSEKLCRMFLFVTLKDCNSDSNFIVDSYTRQQLYELVADVDSYRHFIPFCTASKVLHSSRPDWRMRQEKDNDPPTNLEAELKVGFLGMDESYVSKVECRPFHSVTVSPVYLIHHI